MKTEEKRLYTAPAMRTVELKHQTSLMSLSDDYPGKLGLKEFDQDPVV